MLSVRYQILLAVMNIIFAHSSSHAQAQTCANDRDCDSIDDVLDQCPDEWEEAGNFGCPYYPYLIPQRNAES